MSATIVPNAEPASAELAYTGPARRAEPSGTDLPRDPCPGPSAPSPESGSLGHDPKRAPTLARLERLVGHPVDAEKLRAKLDTALATVEVGPVRTLEAEAPPARVLAPGSYYLVRIEAGRESYEYREELKALHLRWSPTEREWSGVVLGSNIAVLAGLGLAVAVRDGPAPPIGSSRWGTSIPPEPLPSRRAFRASFPSRRRDNSGASAEAYFPRGERESLGRLSRFTLLDITSGLADDSREDDERVRAKAEREREGRVRAARAVIQAHPGLETVLARDQTKLTLFCAVHHVTPDELCPHAETNGAPIRAPGTPRDGMCSYCHGWHAWARPADVADVQEVLSDARSSASPSWGLASVLPRNPCGSPLGGGQDCGFLGATPADWLSEVRAREVAVLPGSECDDG